MRKPDIYWSMTGLRCRCPCSSRLGARVRQVREGVVAIEKIGLSRIGIHGDEVIIEEFGL
jgi:hypothetical protein